MPILNKDEDNKDEIFPGVDRYTLLDGTMGAESLSLGDMSVSPGSTVRPHIHPTEEAMVILDGELEAIIGDQVVTVTAGQTVLAPPGVKHGFVNRGKNSARLMAIFPTATIERTYVD